jgi:hypothetical protein
MSRLRIHHTTTFRYDGEVQASYNELRMRPMMSDRQFVLTETLHATPMTSQHPFIDYWGTRVSSVEILTPHDFLDVVADSPSGGIAAASGNSVFGLGCHHDGLDNVSGTHRTVRNNAADCPHP